MRRLWRFIKISLFAITGLAVFIIALTVVLGLAGVLNDNKGTQTAAAPVPPVRPASSPVAAKAAANPAAPSKTPISDPNDPEFFAWYLVSTGSPHVIVWRGADAMREGLALISDGTAKQSPDMVLPLIACFADSGTRVANLSGGFFSSTVLVELGPNKGCRGDVDNSFLAKTLMEMVMSTRSGWTFNGHHYTTCESSRMGCPIVTYHRDGVRLSERDWRRLMAQDRAAQE